MKEPADQIGALRAAMSGYKLAQILMTSEEIGLFGRLAAEPADVAVVARDLGVSAAVLDRMLTALVAEGVVERNGDRVGLTADWKVLDPATPFAQNSYIRYAQAVRDRWLHLGDAVRGEPIAERNFADITGGDPKVTQIFADAMEANARPLSAYIAERYDFSGRTILDVGGGSGTYCIAVLRKSESAKPTVMDVPEVAAIARRRLAALGLADRIAVTTGNYHEDFPGGPYDDLFLFAIVHQEMAADAQQILSRSFRALRPGGRLLMSSFFLHDDRSGPRFPALFGVEMAVMIPGEVYTVGQATQMLTSAGFTAIEFSDAVPGPAGLFVCHRPA